MRASGYTMLYAWIWIWKGVSYGTSVYIYIYMTYTIYRGNRLSMCIYNDGWGDLAQDLPPRRRAAGRAGRRGYCRQAAESLMRLGAQGAMLDILFIPCEALKEVAKAPRVLSSLL